MASFRNTLSRHSYAVFPTAHRLDTAARDYFREAIAGIGCYRQRSRHFSESRHSADGELFKFHIGLKKKKNPTICHCVIKMLLKPLERVPAGLPSPRRHSGAVRRFTPARLMGLYRDLGEGGFGKG